MTLDQAPQGNSVFTQTTAQGGQSRTALMELVQIQCLAQGHVSLQVKVCLTADYLLLQDRPNEMLKGGLHIICQMKSHHA